MRREPRTYGVYVIELNGDPNHLYIGQSFHTPEERLKQHNTGLLEFRAAKVFRNGARGTLRPDLYKHLDRCNTPEQAMEIEAQLVANLREERYIVNGGNYNEEILMIVTISNDTNQPMGITFEGDEPNWNINPGESCVLTLEEGSVLTRVGNTVITKRVKRP